MSAHGAIQSVGASPPLVAKQGTPVKPLFPKWTNLIPHALLAGVLSLAFVVIGGMWYYATPEFWEVGYMPDQPIDYSHQIHASKLGMDCLYCHTEVKESRAANIPSVSTCMNCHTVVDEKSGYLKLAITQDGSSPSPHWRNTELAKLREYWNNGESIPWARVHKLPDYVHFPHNAHVNIGVSCYSCHQRIDTMPRVFQATSLSMSFCLECHRDPSGHLLDVHGVEDADGLRAPVRVTDLGTVEQLLQQPDYAANVGARLAERLRSAPPLHCAACHY